MYSIWFSFCNTQLVTASLRQPWPHCAWLLTASTNHIQLWLINPQCSLKTLYTSKEHVTRPHHCIDSPQHPQIYNNACHSPCAISSARQPVLLPSKYTVMNFLCQVKLLFVDLMCSIISFIEKTKNLDRKVSGDPGWLPLQPWEFIHNTEKYHKFFSLFFLYFILYFMRQEWLLPTIHATLELNSELSIS